MKSKVHSIIIEVLSDTGNIVDENSLTNDTKLREDLAFDSFKLAELTVHIEEEFGVDIFQNGIVNTLGEIYSRIEESN